jgi:hypothetical protein
MNMHRNALKLVDVRQLAGAGWQGLTSVPQEPNAPLFTPRWTNLAWTSAAVGAATGVIAARVAAKRKGKSSLAIGGAIGSVLGLSVGTAWSTRHFTAAAVRAALCRVNAARDAHWLELNPINYA